MEKMSLTLLFLGSACLALETVHLLLLAAHVQADILQWPDHQQEELEEGCPVCWGGHQPQCLEVLPLCHAGGLSRGHRDQCSLDNAFISLECLCKIEHGCNVYDKWNIFSIFTHSLKQQFIVKDLQDTMWTRGGVWSLGCSLRPVMSNMTSAIPPSPQDYPI